MAAPIIPVVSTPALSQKQRRALLKRDRRKRKRQALAKAKQPGLEDREEEHSHEEEEEDEDDERKAEEERQEQEWLERERLAQEEFRLRTEREDAVRKRQEEEERRIKEEWESQQRREEEEKEQKRKEKKDREEAVQKMLDQAESQLANGGPWMNAEPPDFGTEKDRANCPFFIKTGACRFGDRCSRKHEHPALSATLLVRGMFVTFGLEQSRRDDYDTDASLEYSEEEVQQQFLDFYQDALPEFRTAGKVVQFKVSCNYEPHLRGNVYVQYDTEEQCREALMAFNGRWYAGRQLQCEFCPVTRWKTAICGLFDRQKCPKGKHCNFLHVFRNPDNEFWEADRDMHLSPEHRGAASFRGRWSERRDRDWGSGSWRSNVSLPRSERSHSRRGERRSREKRRSRSRERSKDRRSRSRERRSRSRERRSRSRERKSRERRSRERSRERRRERKNERRDRKSGSRDRRSGSKERESRERERESRERERENRGRERENRGRERKDEWSQSPGKPVKRDGTANDDIITPRHHKHSKKSKKSKKKKHKKKKSLSPRDESSSGDSGKESGGEGNVAEVVQTTGDPGSSPTSQTQMGDRAAAEREVVCPDSQSQLVSALEAQDTQSTQRSDHDTQCTRSAPPPSLLPCDSSGHAPPSPS